MAEDRSQSVCRRLLVAVRARPPGAGIVTSSGLRTSLPPNVDHRPTLPTPSLATSDRPVARLSSACLAPRRMPSRPLRSPEVLTGRLCCCSKVRPRRLAHQSALVPLAQRTSTSDDLVPFSSSSSSSSSPQMPSPLRPNDDQAHPDPPSPPPTPAPSASTAAASSSAAHASSGVGDVGSTSGRSRFYDALRRIGFPHLPARSRESAPAAGHAPAAEEGPAAGPSQPEQAPVSGGPSGSTPEGVGRGPRTGAVPTPPLPSPAAVPSPELNAPADTPPPTGGSPLALANAAAAPPAAAAEHGPAAAPDPSSSIPRGQPYFGLDIMLDANGGPPPTREEMEILMRSLFGPTVRAPPSLRFALN